MGNMQHQKGDGNRFTTASNDPLLSAFMKFFHIEEATDRFALLRRMASAFALLPYENLTKIIKGSENTVAAQARRLPGEVLRDHFALGTGGTCFSLTASLLHLVRAVGFAAEPILADRSYGANTHCALIVWIDREPHLLDPGFLIVDPIPLATSEVLTVTTPFNTLILSPTTDRPTKPSRVNPTTPATDLREGRATGRLHLHTVQQGHRTYRLTFKTDPVDAGKFHEVWDSSFDWEMMQYPLLSRVLNQRQVYLQSNRLQVRSHTDVRRRELSEEEVARCAANEFGIDRTVVEKAMAVLHRHGLS